MLKSPLRSLRGRLAFTYACLAVIGVTASGLYTATTVRNGLHDRVVLDLADEARLLAHEVSEPLARSDLGAVDDEVVRAETLTHARLIIVNPAQQVVAATRGWALDNADGDLAAALSGETTVDTSEGGGLFGGPDSVQVNVPIVLDDGSIVGALQATYSLDE
ncbi:MAG: hypothetical protein JO057_18375, partial [Chloroflexi bacterium]|nr:hypothetical protein [Chloroflexota bacterium]